MSFITEISPYLVLIDTAVFPAIQWVANSNELTPRVLERITERSQLIRIWKQGYRIVSKLFTINSWWPARRTFWRPLGAAITSRWVRIWNFRSQISQIWSSRYILRHFFGINFQYKYFSGQIKIFFILVSAAEQRYLLLTERSKSMNLK